MHNTLYTVKVSNGSFSETSHKFVRFEFRHTFSSRIFLKRFESSESYSSLKLELRKTYSPLFKPNVSGTTRRDGTQIEHRHVFHLLSIFDERTGRNDGTSTKGTDRSIDARHLQTSPNGGEHNRTSPYKLSAKRLIRACQCHGHRAWRTTFP